MADETAVHFAVENMFPTRIGASTVSAYRPSWEVTSGLTNADEEPYPAYTLDLSHTAVSHSDALAVLDAMGERLCHVHVADGTGLPRDEHLIPGRGSQPCAEVLATVAARGFAGNGRVEVTKRRAANRGEREADLAAALAFCRRYLAVESWRA
jgi:sugar phosphate isomerase/epimerase